MYITEGEILTVSNYSKLYIDIIYYINHCKKPEKHILKWSVPGAFSLKTLIIWNDMTTRCFAKTCAISIFWMITLTVNSYSVLGRRSSIMALRLVAFLKLCFGRSAWIEITLVYLAKIDDHSFQKIDMYDYQHCQILMATNPCENGQHLKVFIKPKFWDDLKLIPHQQWWKKSKNSD